MDDAARAKLEADLRSLCARGDLDGAATLVVRGYGPELFGFLLAVHGNEVDAGDSFSDLAEAVWRALPRFAWESTARTWAYAIARNVMRVRKRDAVRRRRRVVNGASSLEGVVQQVRTETLSFLRTEKRTRITALRDALSEEDRMLLVLRVDRGLAWSDIARALGGEVDSDEDADATTVAKDAARLRKRYQAVKDRLRAAARREGLLPDR